MTAIIPRTTVEAIVSARNAALAKVEAAIEAMNRAGDMVTDATDTARTATGGKGFYLVDRTKNSAYQSLFSRPSDGALEAYRQHLDAATWVNIIAITGIESLMDRTARDEFYADLSGDVMPVTEENIAATLASLAGDAELIFQRGVARTFGELDRRFKSHDGFKVGSRIVLSYVFDNFGHFSSYGRTREILQDMDRVFARFDEEAGPCPDLTASARAVDKDRGYSTSPRQSVTETRYYRVKGYKNGNAHLWFTRDDLVQKVNKTLAAYYGEVFPEAPPEANTTAVRDLKTDALSRDLAFYPTPEPVVEKLMAQVYLSDAVVLEPSAGTGNIVHKILAWEPEEYVRKNCNAVPAREVVAVEYSASRAAQIGASRRDPRLKTLVANFLAMTPDPRFTHVIMNPPFAGTHWMAHVIHAYEFLAPGGVLLAVLPASAEHGDSDAHETFRAWADKRRSHHRLFTELPPESFKSSGTRINTVILELAKKNP